MLGGMLGATGYVAREPRVDATGHFDAFPWFSRLPESAIAQQPRNHIRIHKGIRIPAFCVVIKTTGVTTSKLIYSPFKEDSSNFWIE